MRRRQSFTTARLGRLVLLLIVLAAWAAFLRPASLGGPLSLVMVSGQSMEPTMQTGDLAVVFVRPEYGPGDVVAFRPQNAATNEPTTSMVIHRIVGGDAQHGFITQGDGNDWADPWEIPRTNVAGEMLFFVPGAGHLLARVMDPVTLGALFAAVTVFLVLVRSDDETPPESVAIGDGAIWTAGGMP